MSTQVYALLFSIIVFFLLMLICMFILIWCRARFVEGKIFYDWQRLLLLLGIVIAPIFMLVHSLIFESGYQLERGGHWLFVSHEGWAGLSLLPIYIIASLSLFRAIMDEEYMATSGINYIMVATLCVIAGWYTFATFILKLTKQEMGEMAFLGIIPLIACVNYFNFLGIIRKQGRLQTTNFLNISIWLFLLASSLIAKVYFAKQIYDRLPEHRPPSYGNCFVVTAAAKGHYWLVKSWMHPHFHKPVNQQWYTFKHFEHLLALSFPKFHPVLRAIYNFIGPFIVKFIVYRWQADIVYLLLKPLEWCAFIILKISFMKKNK